MFKNKKASTLLYILILINIALIMAVVVFNNSITLSNYLDIWENNEKLFKNIYDKWFLSLKAVKKYNSNWSWFVDDISCPTNVTMSGSTYKETWIETKMAYESWTIFCKWFYRGNDFWVYFDPAIEYSKASYLWDKVDVARYIVFHLPSPYILWRWTREFNDSDSTLISFDEQGTWWWDDIDDNMNSDDYKWSSTWSVNYAFGYEDDDDIPRKKIWWKVFNKEEVYNIFWSNYKTSEFINKNPYNNNAYTEKIGNVWTWYIFLDEYNSKNNNASVFDLRIIQFDKNKYKKLNTLLLTKSWQWKDINISSWYIQKNVDWTLSLSYTKTWKEFPFNFKDNDYAIFMTNKNSSGAISYTLTAETESWTWIYINPINESFSGTIEVMANHILMWWNKNFIWKNFVIVWPK